jgi:hypothetical protein
MPETFFMTSGATRPTRCPECRRVMRLWALDARDPRTPEEHRYDCVRTAIAFRDGDCDWHQLYPVQSAVRMMERAREAVAA